MSSTAHPPVPRWLRIVLVCDRAGSSWYVGTGFIFAPVLALVSPWPPLTAALWVFIAAAGLWLGLLGLAMATGLAMVLRSNGEISEDYWRSIIDYPRVTRSAAADAASVPTTPGNAGATSRRPRPVGGAAAAR
jgi:hypothetical protein